METWEQEITQKNEERLLSLAFQINQTNDFEKAIVDDLSYSDDFRIEKTGKEVKEKLQIEMLTISGEKTTFMAKMELLVGVIKIMPSGKADRWEMRGFEKYLGQVPRMYSHDQIYPNKSDQDCPKSDSMYKDTESPSYFPGEITPVPTKEITDKMREYNQAASDYIRRCTEEIKLKTVIDNLADGKKLKLTPQLASQLGF